MCQDGIRRSSTAILSSFWESSSSSIVCLSCTHTKSFAHHNVNKSKFYFWFIPYLIFSVSIPSAVWVSSPYSHGGPHSSRRCINSFKAGYDNYLGTIPKAIWLSESLVLVAYPFICLREHTHDYNQEAHHPVPYRIGSHHHECSQRCSTS